jgi:transcriptional regulator with GAF, ATPase, and Fis domain
MQFEKFISRLSAEFINLPFDHIDAKIDESLKRIVEAIDIDRVILYEFANEKQQLRLSHYFLKPGIQKPESMIANKDQPGFTKKISNNEIIKLERVADLPEEYKPERKYLMQQGVKSGLAIPLTVEKKPVGALTFTTVFRERSWPDEVVQRLKLIGEIFANAIDRKNREQKLRKALEGIQTHQKLDNMLSTLSTEFINLPFDQIDQKIDDGLELIAKQLCIERVALLKFSRDKSQESQLYLTNTYAIDSRQRAPIFLVSEQLPWFSESLRRGKTLRISMINDMPEEAVAEKQYAKEQGFKSFLAIPMKVDELTIGAISYSSIASERTWSDETVQQFNLVSEIFANALDRKQKEQSLQNSLLKIKQLKDQLQQENIYLREEIKLQHKHGEIIGKSNTIKYVLSQAEQVAETDSTVLILGETGTGKELLARAIHNLSPRKGRPMIKVNCATLPATLIESELFGRGKGAYTGALSSQMGRFEMADGATIFLDEISEMPLELQAKLLRVLQEGEFERLGDPRTINVDVRVIASTNRNLAKSLEQGSFREDLYYRLNVFPITIPPLRERKEDIPLLVWTFAKQFNVSMGKKIDHIANKDMDALKRYQWPGNIRELKNIIERAMILCQDSALRINLPGQSESKASQTMILAEVEKRHIVNTLNSTNWRVGGKDGAADILGLKRTTLLTKMKKLNIQRPKD